MRGNSRVLSGAKIILETEGLAGTPRWHDCDKSVGRWTAVVHWDRRQEKAASKAGEKLQRQRK